MRTLVVVVGLTGCGWMTTADAVAQTERPLVFRRICNIEPGQETAALALVRNMVDLADKKYSGVRMSATKGRWMTGFQSLAEPVDQILFSEQHPDLDSYYDFTEILLADDEFQALQQQTWGLIDVSSCVESRVRAAPER